MARPSQHEIEMFMNITGVSESIAVQKIEEHGGDLNEAINSHFNDGERVNSITTSVPATHGGFINVDEPFNIATAASLFPPFSASRRLNPFSILQGQTLFDAGTPNFATQAPRVSHPRDVREIPIEFKDEISHPGSCGLGPKIEDVTGSVSVHEDVVHGTVIVDDDDNDDYDDPSAPVDHGACHSGVVSARGHPRTNFTPSTDVAGYTDDIEEEMLQAAIEASKRESEGCGKQQFEVSNSLPEPQLEKGSSILEDSDLVHAVSLSMKTAERESARRAQGLRMGKQSSSASDSQPENYGRLHVANGSLERSKSQTSNQSIMDEDNPSFEYEDDEDKEPMVKHHSVPVLLGNAPQQITAPPSTSQRHEISSQARLSGDAFQSDDWGGISSLEHDEAVMLEAAMFGGVPEGTSYHFPHSPDIPSYRAPHPPSPRLTEQRILRELQDDEYLASLRADREKELRIMQETEKRRLEEAAAIEAAVRREKYQKEEAYKKQLEVEEFEMQLATKQASLPQEPSVENENSVTLLIRMPDGSRCERRFLKSDKLQLLFDYIDVGRLVKPGSYRLVRPYPRRSFTDEESQLSLSELGLTSKQEALFLELI